nr:immunoglobulin heavy chain junction region [Mus musculus]
CAFYYHGSSYWYFDVW